MKNHTCGLVRPLKQENMVVSKWKIKVQVRVELDRNCSINVELTESNKMVDV